MLSILWNAKKNIKFGSKGLGYMTQSKILKLSELHFPYVQKQDASCLASFPGVS